MRNLKAWQKLGLIGAISMLPFAVVSYKMASSINTLGVEFAQQEILHSFPTRRSSDSRKSVV